MERVVGVPPPKVYRLIVDKEEHIGRIKDMVGISHHMTDEHFFNLLEHLAREFPIAQPAEPPRVNTSFIAAPPEMEELPNHVLTSLQLVRKRRSLTLNLHQLLEHWPAGFEGHPNILVVSVANTPGGYVSLVPEALNFMVDGVLQIRNGETALLRQREGITIYDNMTDTFPYNRSNFITLR